MTPSRRSDTERELNDLRARAYGPKPDIEADPTSIARLIELEAAHVGAALPVNATAPVGARAEDGSPPARESATAEPAAEATPVIPTTSRAGFGRLLWQRATVTRTRTWFLIGSIVVVLILVSAVAWLLAPHPDATLRPTAGETDLTVIQALNAQGDIAGISTIRQFERYHDIDVWSVKSTFDKTCLVAWDRVGGRFDVQCIPPGVELTLQLSVDADAEDGFGDWLPDGSVISLHLRENTVDVFVHPQPAAN